MSEFEEIVEIVNPWDSVVFSTVKDGVVTGSIRMTGEDIEGMIRVHGAERGEILDLLLKTLETTAPPVSGVVVPDPPLESTNPWEVRKN